MMNRLGLRIAVLAIVAFCLGIAGAAAVLAFIPAAGSPPSVYDDFNWSSTANGYWHVHSYGAIARIQNSILTLRGDSIELDKRFQTDPNVSVVSARLRATRYHKMGLGMGSYHSGTVGLEIDSDGVKCGRGTDFGYRVDSVDAWQKPPNGKWIYVQMKITNPYPTKEEQDAARNLPAKKLKRPKIVCSAWDAAGHLLGSVVANHPIPNTSYVSIDEAYMRTWDSGNNYQIDWIYAGPLSGNPLNRLVRGA